MCILKLACITKPGIAIKRLLYLNPKIDSFHPFLQLENGTPLIPEGSIPSSLQSVGTWMGIDWSHLQLRRAGVITKVVTI